MFPAREQRRLRLGNGRKWNRHKAERGLGQRPKVESGPRIGGFDLIHLRVPPTLNGENHGLVK